jgi:hypothetical protein
VVAIAVAMIVAIETMLAGERSAQPVRPWPEVQPPAVHAPTPITSPAPKEDGDLAAEREMAVEPGVAAAGIRRAGE